MTLFLLGLVIWFAVSIAAGILIGTFISEGTRDR